MEHTRKRERKEHQKEKIFKAAVQCVNDKGSHENTIDVTAADGGSLKLYSLVELIERALRSTGACFSQHTKSHYITLEEDTMTDYRRGMGLVMIVLFITACFGLTGAEEKAVSKDEPAPAEARNIDATATVESNHPPIEPGLACNDCHEIHLDANTTATQLWLSGEWGAKKAGEGVMSKEQLWQEIIKIIGGIKTDSKTYVLGTSMNNIPLTTTAEFTLDPAQKVLYGFHEQGTEKLLHIRNNPQVSLNYHKEFEGFAGDYLCCQIRGRAELLDGTSPDYDQIMISFLPYEEGARVPKDATPQQREELLAKWRQGTKKSMYISKVTIDRITVISRDFAKQGFRMAQRWER